MRFRFFFGNLPNGRTPGVFDDGLPWWLAVWSFHLLAVCQDEEDVFFPLKPQTDVMIQTDPFIAPGVCDLAVFPTGAKYHLPGCRHVQRRPRNATLLGPCMDCFEFQLKSRNA